MLGRGPRLHRARPDARRGRPLAARVARRAALLDPGRRLGGRADRGRQPARLRGGEGVPRALGHDLRQAPAGQDRARPAAARTGRLQQPLRRPEAEAADLLGDRAAPLLACRRHRSRDHGRDHRRDCRPRHGASGEGVRFGAEVRDRHRPARTTRAELHRRAGQDRPEHHPPVLLQAEERLPRERRRRQAVGDAPQRGLGPLRIPLQRIVPSHYTTSAGVFPEPGTGRPRSRCGRARSTRTRKPSPFPSERADMRKTLLFSRCSGSRSYLPRRLTSSRARRRCPPRASPASPCPSRARRPFPPCGSPFRCRPASPTSSPIRLRAGGTPSTDASSRGRVAGSRTAPRAISSSARSSRTRRAVLVFPSLVTYADGKVVHWDRRGIVGHAGSSGHARRPPRAALGLRLRRHHLRRRRRPSTPSTPATAAVGVNWAPPLAGVALAAIAAAVFLWSFWA